MISSIFDVIRGYQPSGFPSQAINRSGPAIPPQIPIPQNQRRFPGFMGQAMQLSGVPGIVQGEHEMLPFPYPVGGIPQQIMNQIRMMMIQNALRGLQ